ncbi:uncharacterized protein LOC122861649 isoform X2 [Siniperca chuatsi]|uniref:uncharacterized protein LOC122861649 isoform X2 n=1 Tax=Siniperca chuatsi TaxID=119488 RepID=UPI001CE0EAE5|nr:uncharacterized protein LOC122861649 isoform X2 [Siniperca chuatsi]
MQEHPMFPTHTQYSHRCHLGVSGFQLLTWLMLFSASQWILTASIGLRFLFKVKEAIPKAAERKLHDLEPGDWIVVKDFRRKNWRARRWNGPYQILLTTETAVKVAERATWIHATHCKRVPEPGPAAKHQTSEIEISE